MVVRSGRIGSPSAKIAERFVLPLLFRSSKAGSVVQSSQTIGLPPPPTENGHPVSNSFVESKDVSLLQKQDPRARIRSSLTQLSVGNKHNSQRLTPTKNSFIATDPELLAKPAFCRRCFKFWKSVAGRHVGIPMILEYCCSNGHNKGIISRYMQQEDVENKLVKHIK
uniref:Uncharacterized protein n=1 Tax=Ditylenchus dipsaci TaxID=166011 RepID=A0A915DKP0_9BILA